MDASTKAGEVDRKLAFAVLRVTLGIDIFIHGAGRIFGAGAGAGAGAAAFAGETAKAFTNTPLPPGLVHLFLLVLPFAELTLGVLITLGLLTRWALTLGGLLIAALVFGTALRSDWTTVGIQMIYAIVYYLLLSHLAENAIALDAIFRRTRDARSRGAR